MSDSAPERSWATWLIADPEAAAVRLWGLSPAERLRRSLAAAGCTDVRLLAPDDAVPDGAAGLVLRADHVYDERLVAALAERAEPVLLVSEGGVPVAARCAAGESRAVCDALRAGHAPAGLAALLPEQLAPAYTAKLRKSEPPYLLPARAEDVASIEARTFSASYKGATDLVTKWVWPLPARWVTRRLAAAQIHPNVVTIASWVLAVLAFFAFAEGSFGWGLAAAWWMTFLDTVDGKLARVTLTSSRLGDVLDHGLDLVHPPFWWWAWAAGVGWLGHPAAWIVIGGYFAGRALEGLFLAGFGFETHSWRPIDTLFRTITARRNPNLILLSVGTAVGHPDVGLLAVAVWTAASLGFHAIRLAQAGWQRWRGTTVEPWDSQVPAIA